MSTTSSINSFVQSLVNCFSSRSLHNHKVKLKLNLFENSAYIYSKSQQLYHMSSMIPWYDTSVFPDPLLFFEQGRLKVSFVSIPFQFGYPGFSTNQPVSPSDDCVPQCSFSLREAKKYPLQNFFVCLWLAETIKGSTASQVVRLIGLLLVFASQKIVHNVQNQMAYFYRAVKKNQRQSD